MRIEQITYLSIHWTARSFPALLWLAHSHVFTKSESPPNWINAYEPERTLPPRRSLTVTLPVCQDVEAMECDRLIIASKFFGAMKVSNSLFFTIKSNCNIYTR